VNRHAKAPSTGSSRRLGAVALATAVLATLVLGATAADAVAPAVTIENATEVAYTTAKAKGTVDSQGQSTHWRFQVATEADFSNAIDGPSGTIEEGASTVKGKLTGLTPETTYHLRLLAENADGTESEEAASTFETKAVEAPTVTNVKASNVEFTRAKASGSVELADEDPGFDASCRFEYVTQAHFETEGEFENPNTIPCEPETIAATSPQPVGVKAQLTGLTPSTTYHLRLVASNLGGETKVAAASTFETGTVTPPTVTAPVVSALTGPTAHFSAEVGPGAPGPAPQDPAFNLSWHFQCSSGPCFGLQGGTIEGDDATHTVENDATDLQPNSSSPEYEVTIVATNGVGQTSEATTSFPTPAAKPLVTAFAAGPVGPESAGLNGEVNPQNSATSYWFEWGSDDCSSSSCTKTAVTPVSFDELQQVVVNATAGTFTLSFEGQTTADIDHGASPAEVQAALEALSTIGSGNVSVSGGSAGTSSRYRVTFTEDLGGADVETLTGAEGATPLTTGEGSEPGSIEVSVITDGEASEGHLYRYVSAHLTGLSPQTTYHFRLMAENAAGTTEGDDQEFTTAAVPSSTCANEAARVEQHAAYLPDCRAYEMVSPPDKQGNEVLINTDRTHAAADGNAVAFASLGGFADVQGGGIAVEYMAQRTTAPGTNGWQTHAITPGGLESLTVNAAIFGQDSLYVGDFTPDLSRAVFRTWRPLTDEPNVKEVTNLYEVSGLRAGETSQVNLISPSFEPLTANIFSRPWYAGASTDLNHVIFESTRRLVENAPSSGTKLYESVEGQVRLAGMVPPPGETECSGAGCEAAEQSQAGQGATGLSYTDKMISADGSRVFFSVPGFFGNVYVRIDGTTTIQLNASEKEPPEGPRGAKLWWASPDGHRALLTTNEGLVAGDEDGVTDVYLWNGEAPAGHRLTRLSVDREPADGHNVTGVIGASDDGSYVYFADNGQLVKGQPLPVTGRMLYVWHDGVTRFVGEVSSSTDVNSNLTTTVWGANGRTLASAVTPDGRHLLFMMRKDDGFAGRGGFAGSDHGSTCTFDNGFGAACRELYLYSADSGRLACVSCPAPAQGPARSDALIHERIATGASNTTWHRAHALTQDGTRLFFDTGEALVPRDTNGQYDPYEYDLRTGEVHLLSSGTDPNPSYFLDASPDGSDVFIATRQKLVGWDRDGAYDLYDARVGGGLPEPPPLTAACVEESCRSGSSVAPPATSPASAALSAGNPKPPKRCPKGTHRASRHGKSRCVKAKKHRKHHHRRANANGRAGR
jgi:hypothetical protein